VHVVETGLFDFAHDIEMFILRFEFRVRVAGKPALKGSHYLWHGKEMAGKYWHCSAQNNHRRPFWRERPALTTG